MTSRKNLPVVLLLAALAGLTAMPAGATSLDTEGAAASFSCPGNAVSFTGFDVTSHRRSYDFEGTCWYVSSELVATNEIIKYRVEGSWEAPDKGREIVTVLSGAGAAPTGTILTIAFKTGVDPWLDQNVSCSNKQVFGPSSDLAAYLSSAPCPVTRSALTDGDRLGITYALLGALNIDIQQPTANRVFDGPDKVLFIGKLNMPGDMDLPANTVMVFKVWTRGWPQPGQETKEFLKFQKVTPMGYANIAVKDIPPGDWWVQARILGKESKFWSPPIPFGIKGADQQAKMLFKPKMLIPAAPLISIAKPGKNYSPGKRIPFSVKHGLGEALVFDVQRKAGEKWAAARLPRPQVSTPQGGDSTVESRALFLVRTPGNYRMRVKTEGKGAPWSAWQTFDVIGPGKALKTGAPMKADAADRKKALQPLKKIQVKPASPAKKIQPAAPKITPTPGMGLKTPAPAQESQ